MSDKLDKFDEVFGRWFETFTLYSDKFYQKYGEYKPNRDAIYTSFLNDGTEADNLEKGIVIMKRYINMASISNNECIYKNNNKQ